VPKRSRPLCTIFVHVYSYWLLVKINYYILMCMFFMSSCPVIYERLFPKIMALCLCQKSVNCFVQYICLSAFIAVLFVPFSLSFVCVIYLKVG